MIRITLWEMFDLEWMATAALLLPLSFPCAYITYRYFQRKPFNSSPPNLEVLKWDHFCIWRLVRRKYHGTVFNRQLALLFALNALRLPVTSSGIILLLTDNRENLVQRCNILRHVFSAFIPLVMIGFLVSVVFRWILLINFHIFMQTIEKF